MSSPIDFGPPSVHPGRMNQLNPTPVVGFWRHRLSLPGTWAVAVAVFFGVLVALYGRGAPVYPVLFLLPVILSAIPLTALTLRWAVGLRIAAWGVLTLAGLTIGLSTIPSWFFMGLSATIGLVHLRNRRNEPAA